MRPLAFLELLLALVAVAVLLSKLAGRLRLPPAAVLIVGGMILAALPGAPPMALDPDLVMVLFLPPLLLASAFFTVWRDFRAELRPILLLALGAVAFTALAVGWAVRQVAPGLPWAACITLGAIVSPPDAVAAKAVLQHLRLPRRLVTILEGESLVNDATGLVLYRFAVVAAMTGTFDPARAAASFVYVAAAGVAIGAVAAYGVVRLFRWLASAQLVILTSFLAAWGVYVAAETAHASGVLAVVTCGLIMGWRQHRDFDAATRVQAQSVWQIVVFLLEALVFIVIGLSLRGVLERSGGGAALRDGLVLAGTATMAAVVARLVWVFPATYLPRLLYPPLRRRSPAPSLSAPLVIGWAGMRGVVSLAAALALPDGFPHRDALLFATFGVILATVLIQGTTLGLLVRWLGLTDETGSSEVHLSKDAARAAIALASLDYVEKHAVAADTGELLHPMLLEEFRRRARITARLRDESEALGERRREHFQLWLAALTAGRTELIRLHRAGSIHDSTVHAIEAELDLEELRLRRLLGQGALFE